MAAFPWGASSVLVSEEPNESTYERRVGTILKGKYRLETLIGVGGMAAVYAATHRNNQEVAIKILHPALSMDTGIRSRFLREGYVANSVRHEGAVTVQDDDVTEDGSVFLVMELLTGATVEQLWARYGRRLPVELVCLIAAQLLSTLHAAHSNGIVHRDIKPANLFVRHDGLLKVMDFGIARVMAESKEGRGTSTQTGMVIGTPAFMAPEQALGKVSAIDQRTDLWAVGATMFTLLSGSFVHDGDTAQQMLVQAATQPVPGIATVKKGIPTAVADVVDRALGFESNERWQSAQEMRVALGRAFFREFGRSQDKAITEHVAAFLHDISPEIAPSASPPSVSTAVETAHAGPERRPGELPPLSILDPAQAGSGGQPRPTDDGGPSGTLPMVARPPGPLELLPPEFQPYREEIASFFRNVFGGCLYRGHNTFELEPGELTTPYRAYGVLVVNRGNTKATFVEQSNEIEAAIGRLEAPERSVVLTISRIPKTGPGARESILRLRKEVGARVIPFSVAEIKRASDRASANALFRKRLDEYHSVGDPFDSGAIQEVADFYGMEEALNTVTEWLTNAPIPIAVVTGPPGSGKTSLAMRVRDALTATQVIEVRCEALVEKTFDSLTAEISRKLSAADAPETKEFRQSLSHVTQYAAKRARDLGGRLILWLEDADWCLRPLFDGIASEGGDQARMFWTDLAKQATEQRFVVIATSVFGFILEERMLDGWWNPLAEKVKVVPVEHLSDAQLERMILEVGRCGQFTFEASVPQAVVQASGGNIAIARRLCSAASREARRQHQRKHILEPVMVLVEHFEQAQENLIANPTTFDGLLSALNGTERHALRFVARRQPTPERFRSDFDLSVPADEVERVVKTLLGMQLLEVRRGRYQLTVPVVSFWLRRHQAPSTIDEAPAAISTTSLVALGFTVSVLIGTAFFIMSQPRETTWRNSDCEFVVNYPATAVPGESFAVFASERCNNRNSLSAISLQRGTGTFADVRLVEDLGISVEDGAVRTGVKYAIKLEDQLGHSDFQFDVVLNSALGKTIHVGVDPNSRARSVVQATYAVVSGLPLGLSLLAGFHVRVREALSKVLAAFSIGRRRRRRASPAQGRKRQDQVALDANGPVASVGAASADSVTGPEPSEGPAGTL